MAAAMAAAMKTLVSLSLSGSVLIALLLALRPLLRRRLSRRWQYYIWLVPLLRLLVPFTPRASLSGALVEELPAAGMAAGVWMGAPDMAAPGGMPPGVLPAAASAPTPGEPAALIWAAVAAVLLLRAALGYRRYLRELRMGSRPAGDGAQTLFREVCAALGLRRIPTLLVNPALASPVQAGVLRPMVVLSGDAQSGEELRAVLLHELTHCRRLDALYKWLLEAAVCLHWFNPLVRLLRREIGRDCELSCDEAVIARLDGPARRAYGSALLAAARPAGISRPRALTLSMSDDGKQLKQRLEFIMNFKKKTAGAIAAAVFLTAVLCVGAVLLGAYTEDLPAPGESMVVVSEPMLPSREPAGPDETHSTPPDGPADPSAESAAPSGVVAEPEPTVEITDSDPSEPPAGSGGESAEQAAVSTLITEKSAEIDWDALSIADEAPAYPLDSAYRTVSNAYGSRIHPITGLIHSHPGIDIRADSGAAVCASRSGVVLLSAYGTEYGNYVVVGYGDGDSVLYAQMTANTVSEGDSVTQGQVVGYVGKTGMATGDHLHLELREGGARVDPETRFSDISFTHEYSGE